MTAPNSTNPPRGFAGLASLASDIPDAPRSTPRADVKPTEAAKPAETARPTSSVQAAEPAQSQGPAKLSAARQPPSNTGIVPVAVMSALALIGFAVLKSNDTGQTPPRQDPPPTAASMPYETPTYQPAPTPAPAPTPQPQPIPTPRRESAQRDVAPSPGTGLAFTPPQISYCLAEEIRLEAMEPIINKSSETHIKNYNARIHDYNVRCSNFKYRQKDMDTARASVETRRDKLQAEATNLVASWY